MASEDTQTQKTASLKSKALSISTILFLLFSSAFVLLFTAISLLYFLNIPELFQKQLSEKAEALAMTMGSAGRESILTRNYLSLNKLFDENLEIPGVAFLAVTNARGIPIAGRFNNIDRFAPAFAQDVQSRGFPKEITDQLRPKDGESRVSGHFNVGGQVLFISAQAISNSNGSVMYVGLFTDSINKSLARVQWGFALTFMILAVIIGGMVTWLAQSLAKPLAELTDLALRVSRGNVKSTEDIRGPKEIEELYAAFRRLQTAVAYALTQMKK
jgi:methyl-accepting chemotaxis protein